MSPCDDVIEDGAIVRPLGGACQDGLSVEGIVLVRIVLVHCSGRINTWGQRLSLAGVVVVLGALLQQIMALTGWQTVNTGST